MNEEQAVLDFFAREENLPLALIAAEHLDAIRLRQNNEFWQALRGRLDALVAHHSLPWASKLAEDRNTDDCLVGLYLQPSTEPRIFLRPFMEQQFIGDGYRLYHGLMWSGSPEPGQKALPAVEALRDTLQQTGFKQGDNMFAWQWLPWHPRRRDFLLKFAAHRDALLDEVMQPWQKLLLTFGEQLDLAHRSLGASAPRATISLDQLRGKLPSQGA